MEDVAPAAPGGSLEGASREAPRRLIFRNYRPIDQKLKELFEEEALSDGAAAEQRVEAALQAAIAKFESTDVLTLVVPAKADWELKRDLQRKLGALRGKTEAGLLQCAKVARSS